MCRYVQISRGGVVPCWAAKAGTQAVGTEQLQQLNGTSAGVIFGCYELHASCRVQVLVQCTDVCGECAC